MFSKINDLHLYISTLLKECPIKDDDLVEENGIINDDDLKRLLNTVVSDIEKSSDNIIKNSFSGKVSFEKDNLSDDKNYSHKLLFYYQLCEDIYNTLTRLNAPYPNDEEIYFKLALNGLQQFRAITSLYISGCEYSIIPLFRSLYENLIIFLFIAKHPELKNDFLEHFNVEFHKIIEDSNLSTDESKQNFNSTINSHLDGFETSYGWTAKAIPERKNRKLEFMAKEVGYESFSPVYKLACSFVHSSCLAIHVSYVEKPSEDFMYLFVENSINFIADFITTLSQNITISKSSKIIILNLLYHIKVDLGFK